MTFWTQIIIYIQIIILAKGLPKRLDLGIVIDTSSSMDSRSFNIGKDFTENLLQHYSISQGTTRVSLVNLNEKTRQLFSYQKHANREYVLATLKNISCCSEKQVRPRSMKKAVNLFLYGSERQESKTFILIGENSFETLKREIENHRVKNGHEIIVMLLGKVIDRSMEEDCMSLRMSCFVLPSVAAIGKIIEEIGIPKENYKSCSGNGKVFDECERHCDCIDEEIQNCYRIRKEFTQMTKQERQRYVKTYMKLTTEQPNKNRYEKFVYLHFKYFCYGIHKKDLFCPWHRFYILQMENLLREIDCRVTLPYWDWSFVAADPWNTTGIWRKTNDGLGGNGVKTRGFCVQSGVFRQGKWYTPFFNDALDIVSSTWDLFDDMKVDDINPDLSDCLRRFFFGYLPDELFVKRSLDIQPDNFEDFDINLRINYHDRIHNAIGGTMCTHYAATAPEFFLHHSFLDKIWFMWQQKSTAHRNAHFNETNAKLMGFTHLAKDLIDSHNLPGHIKVTYSKFPERKIEKRESVGDGEYIDDNNKPTNSIFHGILQTTNRKVFPSCGRSKKAKRRADQLFDLFSRGKD